MKSLMLDFETLDTRPTTVVLSLGAVLFDREKIIEEQYFKFDVQSQLDFGRSVSLSTMLWWMGQSEDAQKVLVPNKEEDLELHEFVEAFDWFVTNNELNKMNLNVWGNGATFDIAIMNDILRDHGQPLPWNYWGEKCYRTFNDVTQCKQMRKFEGVKHNALDDARHQANCLLDYWRGEKP
jgi:hypothetical protein